MVSKNRLSKTLSYARNFKYSTNREKYIIKWDTKTSESYEKLPSFQTKILKQFLIQQPLADMADAGPHSAPDFSRFSFNEI